MKSISLAFIFLLFFSSSYCQNSSSNEFKWSTFLTRNFNPGVSLGAGAGRPLQLLPTLQLQTGRFNTKWIYLNSFGKYGGVYSLQIEADAIEVNSKKEFNKNTVSLSGGWSHYTRNAKYAPWHEQANMLIGLNQYKVGGRQKISFKLGAALTQQFYNTIYAQQWYPYGEISYNLYAFKFNRDKNSVTLKDVKQAGSFVWSKLPRYFNPFWSNGVGLDRFVVTPALGLKTGRVSTKASLYSDFTAGGGGALSVSVNINKDPSNSEERYDKWKSASINSFTYSIADGGSDGYLSIISVLAGKTLYKKQGRHSLDFKAGVGFTRSSDLEVFGLDIGKTEYYRVGLVPSLSASYDLYLFKFKR